MARTGIYKSEVKKARDVLLAQGKNPSIDAVRAELGNTGSKTTIYRYLKELEEEEGAGFGHGVTISEVIQDLIGRLAQRLHEESEVRIGELQARHAEQIAQRDAEVVRLRQEAEGFCAQLQRTEIALQSEQAVLDETRKALQVAAVLSAQHAQQLVDFQERLTDNEAHLQSLEAKHQHAREALEHYREAAKQQREQEQRRHEQQVQHLQAELRTLNQTLIVKQNELTHAYQDGARTGAELVATRKELHRSELQAEKTGKIRDELQTRSTLLEANVATLTERLQQLNASRDELHQLLQTLSAAALLAPAAEESHTSSATAGEDDGTPSATSS